jgi:hypothetical protein
MIPLQEFKDVLAGEAKKLTEEEILKMRDNLDKQAEIFFNMWFFDIKKKKYQNDK